MKIFRFAPYFHGLTSPNEKSIRLQDAFSLCKFWLALTVTLQSGSLTDLYNQTKKNASDNLFRTGFVAGTDVRIYLTEHFGLVASGRFIMDFDKKEVPVTVYGKDTGESYPTIEFSRRSLYGGIGCVVKLF